MTSQACTRQWDKKVKFGNSFITRLFTIPVEQKKCQGISCYCVSEKRELKKICKDIMKKTGVHIEVSSLNNQNLMIVVMGKDDAVLRAQQKFVNKLKPQDVVNVSIPKEHHRFILGKKGKKLIKLEQGTNTKISVPRPLNYSDVIKISGTKEGIEKAACEIQVIIDKKTGVSVEVPSLHSPSETTFLRGYQEKLGPGPSHLFEEASKVMVAEVSAPSWLHKYIIGRKGASIKHVIQDFPMVLVEFNNRASKIKLEGPQCELERASKTLENMIADLKASFTYEEIHVNPHYYRHVAEKYRDNVYGLQNETLIMAHLSSDSEQRSLIRIEGNLADVTRVKQELQEMVHKMNEEITKECMIDKRFHDNIIGSKGEKVKNIRDKFNQVNIELPEQGIKSGKVRIRGCKEDVENCYQYLVQLNQDLLANNYCHKFQVYSQFLKYIIDKGRSEIWKIETETETKIVLPPENSKTNTLIIIGKKENVMASEKRITSLQDELGNVEDVDVIIPAIFHQSIIGIKGQQIRSISANCGYVRIVFPRRGSIKDKFILRGPKEDVDKAKHQLTELLQKKQQFRFTVELKARPEYHKFLIGVKGANVKKVRQKTGARIVFPTNSDEGKETITITGHKEAAMEAKKILEDMMEDLVLRSFQLNKRVSHNHYRHIIHLKGSVISRIEQTHKVRIHIPKKDPDNRILTITGYEQCAEAAMQDIYKIICRREEMVTEEVYINYRFHFLLIGTRRCIKAKIMDRFNVDLEFGRITDLNPNVVTIIGMKDDVKNCKDYLLNFREKYIVKRRRNEKMIMGRYQSSSSSVQFPFNIEFNSENTGTTNNTEDLENTFMNVEEQCQQSRFTEELKVKPEYHRFLIGIKWANIKKVKRSTGTRIVFPTSEDEDKETIRITGNQNAVMEAKEILEKTVENTVIHRINLPFKVKYKHIIGSRGYVISRIQQKRKVHVHIPKNEDPDNRVIITGYQQGVQAAVEDIRKIIRRRISSRRKIEKRVTYRYYGNTIVCPKLGKVSSLEHLEYLKDRSLSLKKPKNKRNLKKHGVVYTKKKVIEPSVLSWPPGARRRSMKRIARWHRVDLRIVHRLFPITGMKKQKRKLCIPFAELEKTICQSQKPANKALF